MKLIAALAALVQVEQSKNDDPWSYKVVELQSDGFNGFGDSPTVTHVYHATTLGQAQKIMRDKSEEYYNESAYRHGYDVAPFEKPSYLCTNQYAVVSSNSYTPWKDMWFIMKEGK